MFALWIQGENKMNEWLLLLGIGFVIGLLIGYKLFSKKLQGEQGNRKKLAGNYAQKFVPFLAEFKYNPQDCYFLGMPTDFIIFDGLNDGLVNKIVFVEVKTGGSQISKRENLIK